MLWVINLNHFCSHAQLFFLFSFPLPYFSDMDREINQFPKTKRFLYKSKKGGGWGTRKSVYVKVWNIKCDDPKDKIFLFYFIFFTLLKLSFNMTSKR
jgi:hypothetical protein